MYFAFFILPVGITVFWAWGIIVGTALVNWAGWEV